MSRIAIDARLINSSTGRYIEQLLEALQNQDEQNEYYVIVPSRDLGHWKPRMDNFHLVSCDAPPYSFAEQTVLLRKLNELEPDLVHFCMPQQPLFYLGKSVTTIHDLTLFKTYNDDKNWIVYQLKRLVGAILFAVALRRSVHLIAVSKFTKADIVKLFRISPGKISVTYESPTGFDLPAQDVQLPFSRYLLYVGRQPRYKNIRALAEVFQKLVDRYPDLGLVLAGSRNDASDINERAFRKRGFRNIHFTGRVSEGELSWLYKNGLAYVFPSYYEGFGLPGLEAMSLGLPVASSDRTCLPEVYGDAAVYFDPSDNEDIEQTLDRLIRDPELRADLRAKGLKRVDAFSWDQMARETLAIYESALL